MATKIVTFWRVACGNILIVLLNVLDPSHNNLGYTQHHIIYLAFAYEMHMPRD